MAEVTFDCTQFLSFDVDGDFGISSLNGYFEGNGYDVLFEKSIEPVKLTHLRRMLQSITIELRNQEFMGEFDEWFEMENIPSKIVEFGDVIQELYKNEYIKNLTVILVRYAYNNYLDDQVFFGEYRIEDVNEGLYNASCFGNSGNIVALRFVK
ncbi:hypothetical protein [Brevibacillus dissolubilis]|uniref:hypothetical protein n=1 Tax=Brevibacillus dissolubilis TaxID=1844116 RepID=UPI001115EB6A|nr:hypothetical protein [Brevibacillus dissolubilis]